MLPLRECVVGIISNDRGEYLVGERADAPGCWQLPQGGVESGESPQQAIIREMGEELGCSDLVIVRYASTPISYEFPKDATFAIAKKYRGQTQTWFLLKFNESAGPNLALADHEFVVFSWKSKEEIIAGIVPWKRAAYIAGFGTFDL